MQLLVLLIDRKCGSVSSQMGKKDADMNRMLKQNKPLESDEGASETLIALASVADMNRILKNQIFCSSSFVAVEMYASL